MRIEDTPTDNDSGQMRAWLDADESNDVRNYYDEDPRRQIAIRLMLECGFRSEEITRVTKSDIVPLDTTEEAFRIRVWESKNGYRATPLPTSLKQQLTTYANSLRLGKDDELIDVTPRTIQNWVTEIAEDFGEYDEDTDEWGSDAWSVVSAHDLRRTWATDTVQSGVPETVVMSWGGWDDYQTFTSHYLGRESDERTVEYMQRAGLN